MSHIDYNTLDGGSPVARRSAGIGVKFGVAALGLLLAGGLIWVNWPNGPSDKNTSTGNDEAFETSTFSPRQPTPPAPMAAPTEQIVLPMPDAAAPMESADVNQTVMPGRDMAEERRLLEQRLREEEARRRAEEEARRREEESRLADADRKRRQEEEKLLWERYRSNQIVTDAAAEMPTGEGLAIAADGQLVPVPGADSDPNKAFLAQAEGRSNSMARATRNDRTDALIAEGTMIRGFLETAINTDLPGMVRSVVREDVYSLDGRRVLIPKGSRLTGEYRSGIARGQTRVFIVWNRMIRSDGVSVNIGSPGADSLGRGGMAGRVDRHWFERFGSAIVLSIVGGAAEYLSAIADPGSRRNTQTISRVDPVTGEITTITIEPERTKEEARQIAIERSASTMTELAKEAFDDSRNIPPTIYVDQGTSVIVFVRCDLDFSSLYVDPVQEELARLKRGWKPRVAIDPVPLYMTPKDNWYPPAPVLK